MKEVSTSDLNKMDASEKAALYSEVFNDVAQARKEQRDGETALRNIRRAQTRRTRRPKL